MKFHQAKKGYSLVEVLVATTVLLIAIVGPLTIAANGLKKANFSKAQNTAFFLAQEGLESVIKAREDNALKVFTGDGTEVWDDVDALDDNDACTVDEPCAVDVSNGGALSLCSDGTCDLYLQAVGRDRYSHDDSGQATRFNRQIVLQVNDERAFVRSIVSWGTQPDETVELSTYIYNIYAN